MFNRSCVCGYLTKYSHCFFAQDNFSNESTFCINEYQTKTSTNNMSSANQQSTVMDNILLDKAMLPELDCVQPYIHDAITNPVLTSYQTNYKFVNDLVRSGDTNERIENMATLNDSNDVLFSDVVYPKDTVLKSNTIQNIDYSMKTGSDYIQSGLMLPNTQHNPMETILIPLTSIESMNNQHTTGPTNLLVTEVKNPTKVKNKRPKQTKVKNVTAASNKRRKLDVTETKTSKSSTIVPFLSFAPKNDAIDQISALQSDNSTIFPMAITGYDDGNADNLLAADTDWTAFNVPTSFNISTMNLNNVTDSKNRLVHISQITQADILNCLYQEPQSTVPTEHINCIEQSIPDNLINANFPQFCLAEPIKTVNDEHQLIVCNAGMLTKTPPENWTNDCHSIIRSPSILPQLNEIDSINKVAETDPIMCDGHGSFVLQT